MSPDAKASVRVNGRPVPWRAPLPINDPEQVIEFESATFAGRCLVRIAELAPNPRSGAGAGSLLAEPYFAGRKRKMQVVIQGRFKRPLRFDQVCTPFARCRLGPRLLLSSKRSLVFFFLSFFLHACAPLKSKLPERDPRSSLARSHALSTHTLSIGPIPLTLAARCLGAKSSASRCGTCPRNGSSSSASAFCGLACPR